MKVIRHTACAETKKTAVSSFCENDCVSVTATVHDPVQDAILQAAFQELSDIASEYITYSNDYGSVSDWDTPVEDTLRNLRNAYTASVHKTPEDTVFFSMMRGNLRGMRHAYNPSPLDPREHQYIPGVLQGVYGYMGYQSIEKIAFESMSKAFVNTYGLFQHQRGRCPYLDDKEEQCTCEWTYNSDMPVMDILECRDIPRAVIFMHEAKNYAPIDKVVFWDLMDMVEEYSTYSNDFDNWNDPEVAAFREFSEVVNYISYVCPDWFPKFTQLPTELRELVIHEYALLEQGAGRLRKHRHHNGFRNPCCMWQYPYELIACDNQETSVFSKPEAGRCPQGWLPNLASVSHQMHEEVLVLMLQRTKCYDSRYHHMNKDFNMATWFRQFLDAIPGGRGKFAVKHLNFPHMHWFNHQQGTHTLSNSSFELAVACKNLRQLDMTFHVDKISICNQSTQFVRHSRPLASIINKFMLETLFGCENLEEIYIDGIYRQPYYGGKPAHLNVLEDLGKWLMKGFLVQRSPRRGIRVELVRRWGYWMGRVNGDQVTLNAKDMAEADARIRFRKAYIASLTLPGSAAII
ncbi:hypothetical protein Ptr902_00591 [Pyrenophora tritici-repentis]|nr:hypothetical protein Ptr902_00591 [Pyrenophora tritici-repentis]